MADVASIYKPQCVRLVFLCIAWSTSYVVQMNICGVALACPGNDTAVCIDDTVLGLASTLLLQLHNDLLQLSYHSGQ